MTAHISDKSPSTPKQEFHIVNRNKETISFHLEPWGDEILIPTGFFLRISFFGGFNAEPFQITYHERKVIAWFNGETTELKYSLEQHPSGSKM